VGKTLQRLLGPVRALDAGQWTDGSHSASGRPVLACPDCGERDEIDPAWILESGRLRYVWACPSERCAFRDFLMLEAWREQVLS
jgi:hypothetical protein